MRYKYLNQKWCSSLAYLHFLHPIVHVLRWKYLSTLRVSTSVISLRLAYRRKITDYKQKNKDNRIIKAAVMPIII
jgi:hypothetical protein